MKFYIETERLILREIQETDIDGMFELDSNTEVHKYLGNEPIKTKEKAARTIKFIHQQYKELGIGRFACIEKATGEFIGWSGLKLNTGDKEKLNGFTDFVDIGYRFIPRFWGKGYASESASACLEFGFQKMKYETIYGAADVQNLRSNKVLEKIGLQFVNKFDFNGIKANWYELNNKAIETKNCLECKEKVVGRIDKKFCSDYCRNTFNNKVNKESKNLIRNTNNRLRKNYKILTELNVSGKTKVTRRKLFDRGFDFRLFTSMYTTKTGNVYFYIYDQGYLELENEMYLLVKQD